MIHTNRIVTVGEQECIIDRPIVLYRGDREVEIEFTLVGNEFMFSEEGNVIKSVNASHGQLVLNTPSGEHMFSELAECHEGKVVFVVTKEMIDEFIEMGFYSFQIRLYDSAEMKSRVTIPPVMNGFDIRNPIAAEDETNVVDQGIVDYARIFKDQFNEELPTFDWTGAYNKTEWVHHDVITENKMNKIEDALYSINANVKESDVVMLNALDNVKKDADAYVKEHMAEVEADVEEFERNLNTDVQKFKVDTNAAMTAHKNEVSEVVDGFSGEIESINTQLTQNTNILNTKFINVKYPPTGLGAIGDGINDDTNCLQTIIDSLNDGDVLFFPKGLYKTTSTLIIKRAIKLQMQGTIVAHHSNTTLLFKNDEPQGNFSNNKADIYFLDCEISITRDSTNGDKTNENAIGVEIWNAFYPRFLFKKVTNNYTGIKLKAEKYGTGYAGVTYGTFFITLLNNYHCNIYIETGTDGYITQNQFYGGSLTGGYGAGDDSVHIFLNNIGNSVVNENTFFGNSLEGHMKIAVKGKGVTGNKFISLRYEMPSMTNLIDFVNCQRNEFTNSEYAANAMFNNLFNIETAGSMSTKGHNTLIEYIDYRIGKVTYFDGIFYITPLANLSGAYSGSNNGFSEIMIPKTWEQVEIIKDGYADAFMYTTSNNTVDGILTIPCCYNDKHVISEQVEFSTIKLQKTAYALKRPYIRF